VENGEVRGRREKGKGKGGKGGVAMTHKKERSHGDIKGVAKRAGEM